MALDGLNLSINRSCLNGDNISVHTKPATFFTPSPSRLLIPTIKREFKLNTYGRSGGYKGDLKLAKNKPNCQQT